jgi:glucokinase
MWRMIRAANVIKSPPVQYGFVCQAFSTASEFVLYLYACIACYMKKTFLGIEIGGTKLQIVSGDQYGRIERRQRYRVEASEGAAGIRRCIEEALLEWKGALLSGVGVGFGGPVDRATGSAWTSYHIGGWAGFGIKDWLTDLTGAPVVVENDANVAALGEAMAGSGQGVPVVYYVTLGSGVGGGLVIGQEMYHGIAPGENELGHLRLDKGGRTLESACSGWSVNIKIREQAAKHPESMLARLAETEPGAEAKILMAAVDTKDAGAIEIFRQTTDDLAFGLSHVVHLFHPAMIILGGGFSLAGKPLRDAVAQALPGYLMDAFRPGPDIRLSALKEDAVPVGALILAARQ